MTAIDGVLRRAVQDRISARSAFLEAETQGGASGLGGVAVTPGEPIEPPADLDRGCERCLECRRREAGEAKEATVVTTFDRPLGHPVRLEPGLDRVDQPIALVAGQDAAGSSA